MTPFDTMDPNARPPALVGVALITAIVSCGLGTIVLQLLVEGGLLEAFVLVEIIPPLLLAAGIAWIAWQARHDSSDLALLAAWAFGGWLIVGLIAFILVVYQNAQGVHITRAHLLVNNAGIGGAFLASLIGWYDMRRSAQHQHAQALGRRLEFLNRIMRHDIRNDATVALGMLDLLEDDVGEDERIDTIRRSGEHIVELTHLSREIAQAREKEGELEHVPVLPVLQDSVERVRSNFPEAAVHATINIEPSTAVVADELLGSVFDNLLRNAVQHNDKHPPKVWVTAREAAEGIEVTIEDNGPGIPSAMRAQLFQEGVKGQASAGSGLGLYLVQALLERYGGQITVEDRDPEGTRFTLDLLPPPRHDEPQHA